MDDSTAVIKTVGGKAFFFTKFSNSHCFQIYKSCFKGAMDAIVVVGAGQAYDYARPEVKMPICLQKVERVIQSVNKMITNCSPNLLGKNHIKIF